MIDFFWEFFLNYVFMLIVMMYITKRNEDVVKLMKLSFVYTSIIIGIFYIGMYFYDSKNDIGNYNSDTNKSNILNINNKINVPGFGEINLNDLKKKMMNKNKEEMNKNYKKLNENKEETTEKVYKKDKYGFSNKLYNLKDTEK